MESGIEQCLQKPFKSDLGLSRRICWKADATQRIRHLGSIQRTVRCANMQEVGVQV